MPACHNKIIPVNLTLVIEFILIIHTVNFVSRGVFLEHQLVDRLRAKGLIDVAAVKNIQDVGNAEPDLGVPGHSHIYLLLG